MTDCKHHEKGFTTRNDMERHEWGLHSIFPRSGKAYVWKCSCDKKKLWSRVDNFRQHVKRLHPENSSEEFIKR